MDPRKIAPGEWDGDQRQQAKRAALPLQFLGILLIFSSSSAGTAVALRESPSMIALVFFGALFLAGAVFAHPSVAVPIAYRIIDRFGED